ncbi:MAG: hypothetical protein NT039_00610 [Candidatus Berkelbacteria bacterium]|nr:hypothetical protein [Candidatus Berkelbacteria bacterium]
MKGTKKKILFLAFALILLSSSFCLSDGSKAENQSISLKIAPLTYKLTIQRGESDSEIVSIINPNQIPIKVVAETSDFVQGDEEGSPKFVDKEVGKTALASWIDIDQKEIPLEPNEKKDITFTVNVPNDAENGGHYAAIFFKTVPKEGEGGQITISNRVGSLVLVTVPGDIKSTGEIVEFKVPKYSQKGPIDFVARFKNTGTVHYQLGGTIKITNYFGKEVVKLDLPEHIVLPDSIRRFEAQWLVKWAVGRYEANLEMRDGDGNLRTSNAVFYIFPWKIALAILVLIILLIVIIIIVKKALKRKNKSTITIRQQ